MTDGERIAREAYHNAYADLERRLRVMARRVEYLEPQVSSLRDKLATSEQRIAGIHDGDDQAKSTMIRDLGLDLDYREVAWSKIREQARKKIDALEQRAREVAGEIREVLAKAARTYGNRLVGPATLQSWASRLSPEPAEKKMRYWVHYDGDLRASIHPVVGPEWTELFPKMVPAKEERDA